MWWRKLDAWETTYPEGTLYSCLVGHDASPAETVKGQLAALLRADPADIHLFYSGTAAIEAAVAGVTETPGNVIVPDYTCPTVAEAILEAGCRPVVVDVTWPDLTPDVDAVEEAAIDRTVAIVAPHVSGVTAPVAELQNRFPDIPVIEDLAQGFGSQFPDGALSGTKGDIAVLSFSNKHVGIGKGGALVDRTDHRLSISTDKPSRYDCLRALHTNADSLLLSTLAVVTYPLDQTHGFRRGCCPFNVRLLTAQLDVLDQLNHARQRHARRYHENLSTAFAGMESEILTPIHEQIVPLQCLISVPAERRETVIEHLETHRIHAAPGWPTISDSHPDGKICTVGQLENAARASETVIGLPLSPKADDSTIDLAAAAVLEALEY